MKITGKFWLKSGQCITKTVDVEDNEEKIQEVVKVINDIRASTARAFKNTLQHPSLDFGQLTLRVDDCSAVWFKEVVAK